jgi:exopolysaccharide production protein ExoZ
VERERIDNLQLLRLLAAFAILFSHAADRFLADESLLWRVPWVAGVDLFFVISGFVMGLLARDKWGSPGEARRFLLRRAIRIVPAYWFLTLLLAATALVAGGQIDGSRPTPGGLAASFLFLPWPRPSDGQIVPLLAQGWTLNYEAFFYLAVGLALLSRRGPWLLAGGFLLLCLAGPLWPADWWAGHFYSDLLILLFLAGMGLAWLHGRGVRVGGLGACLLGVSAAAWLLLVAPAAASLGRAAAFGPAAVLAVAGAALLPQSEAGAFKRLLILGGDASYALYLSHPFVIGAAVRLLPAVGLQGWAALVPTLLLALGTSIAFHLMVERPVTLALRRRFT